MVLSASTSNRGGRRRHSRLRQAPQRPVPTHLITSCHSKSFVLVLAALFCLVSVSFVPIYILEHMESTTTSNVVSVHQLLHNLRHPQQLLQQQAQPQPNNNNQNHDEQVEVTKDDHNKKDAPLSTSNKDKSLARGIAGRPMHQTPALVGAQRGRIRCDVNVDALAYWNDPQGHLDIDYKSPFQQQDGYISFAPDRGGWNNVRMSMEIIFVLAAVTNRTLVLPPKEPMYLMHHDKQDKYRGFADFFPLVPNKVRVISMPEFLEREGGVGGRLEIPAANRTAVTNAAPHCDKRKQSTAACDPIFDYLATVGHNPNLNAVDSCVVFDERVHQGQRTTPKAKDYINKVCGPKRQQVWWNVDLSNHLLLHFHANEKEFRLLTHFYGMIKFTNSSHDHHYKRFVRDFLHYHDAIYCAAGKIVQAVQKEGLSRGFALDSEGGGGYSALHVRRGDLQYKKVKIPAAEWYNNTKEVWKPNEILYVATDERNKTFFDDLARRHDLRFLDDYWDMAGLSQLDPNYMGMIDTIVASRGRAFAGTWFSTFTGYINRLRGYHGMSMMDSWYSFLPKKTAVHEWKLVDDFAYAFEWPDGWIGIDADEWPTRDKF